MSTADDPICRSCRVSMVMGTMLDRAHGGELQLPQWTPGKPREKKFLGLRLGYARDEKESVRVTTWRCPRCGLLESYAR